MILTSTQLCQSMAIPRSRADLWVDLLNAAMARFDIVEPLHVCAFLAQIGHESARLTAVEENLFYSAAGLRKVFGKYFTAQQAAQYAKRPQAIANRVYANRLGNGDESSGDGWRYRGKGLIQITGRRNHVACGLALDLPLEEKPELLTLPANAAMSAAWFWWNAALNRKAGDDDIRNETRVINGGENGLPDRQAIYDAAKAALGVK
jgi:putative chitinase